MDVFIACYYYMLTYSRMHVHKMAFTWILYILHYIITNSNSLFSPLTHTHTHAHALSVSFIFFCYLSSYLTQSLIRWHSLSSSFNVANITYVCWIKPVYSCTCANNNNTMKKNEKKKKICNLLGSHWHVCEFVHGTTYV